MPKAKSFLQDGLQDNELRTGLLAVCNIPFVSCTDVMGFCSMLIRECSLYYARASLLVVAGMEKTDLLTVIIPVYNNFQFSLAQFLISSQNTSQKQSAPNSHNVTINLSSLWCGNSGLPVWLQYKSLAHQMRQFLRGNLGRDL